MSVCDLCGKSGAATSAMVEGVELTVCERCARFGKLVKKPVSRVMSFRPKVEKPIIVEVLVSDYAKRLRSAREKSGKTQEEFAKMVNERESLIHKFENGTMKPPLETAKKLERLLNISLVQVEETSPVDLKQSESGPLTIGDILKVKK